MRRLQRWLTTESLNILTKKQVHTNISSGSLEGSPLLNIEGEVIGLVTVDKGKVVGAVLPKISKLIGN